MSSLAKHTRFVRLLALACVAGLLLVSIPAWALAQSDIEAEVPQQAAPQSPNPQTMQSTMQMSGMGSDNLMSMHPDNFLQAIVRHASSGTSAEPNSTPVPMLMEMTGRWMLMFHANVFLIDQQESNVRGQDKFFSTNWFMGMAQRRTGPGVFTARVMLSLEPATVSHERYPLLFQEGETAHGIPISDGQHPHDFIMELAAMCDMRLGERGLLSFYFAPVGDPAIGPVAYPHRASASEDPLAALGHHQEDSTHISDDVLTVGLTYRIFRLEASGFHGREPDEYRWDIDQGRIDSWAIRTTLQPGRNWSGQFSYSRIKSIESTFPGEDQARMTASISYNRPFHSGNWASTILWGRTNTIGEESVENSYLLESTVAFLTTNHGWTRIENAGRTNLLVVGENPLPPGFVERPIGHVQAYTFGYDRDFDVVPHMESALGAQVTSYVTPTSVRSIYGSHPVGVAVFVRLRPFSGTR